MKRISVIIAAALLVFSACSESQSGKGYSIVDDTIVFDTPERAEGQESVLGLRTDPLETVRVGFIGLGMRGPDAVKRFQSVFGLPATGKVDYPTWYKISEIYVGVSRIAELT